MLTKNLATLSPVGTWKVENVSNEVGDHTKEISRQSPEGPCWPLAAYIKMQEERQGL